MALDGCGLLCKYILIIFNIIFAVVGFAFLGLGLWLRFSNNTRLIFEIQDFSSSTFVVGVTVLIVLGSLMLIVVMFGDYGACNEKRCALQVPQKADGVLLSPHWTGGRWPTVFLILLLFSVLLAMLATAEIVVGVLAYSKSDEAGAKIVEFYNSLYVLYARNQDPGIAVTLTFVHKMLHCCGMTGVSIIEIVQMTCPKPDGWLEHIVMPRCPGVIEDAFRSNAPVVMGIFIGTGALLITAIICTTILLKQTKRAHREMMAYYTTVY